MDKSLITLAIVFIITSFISTSTAIKCYNCISKTNPNCANVNEASTDGSKLEPQECSPELISTVTHQFSQSVQEIGKQLDLDIFGTKNTHKPLMECQKLENLVNGEKLVTRSCVVSVPNYCENLKKLSAESNGKVDLTHCSLCDTDGCNHAFTTKNSVLFTITATICTVVFSWFTA